MSFVSVVVAVRNEEQHIESCLRSILENGYPDFEIVVIDDASDDQTAACLSRVADARVRVFRNATRRGPGHSRNRGVRESRAGFIFFLDADCRACPGWIRHGLDVFERPDTVAVEGALHYEHPDPSLYEKVPLNPFYNLTQRGLLSIPNRDYPSGNFAVRKSVFEKLGGFRADRYPNGREDTDLGRRLAVCGTIRYAPAMKAVHRASVWTLRELLESSGRYAGDVVFCKDHGAFHFRTGILLHPRLLAMLLFPPLLLGFPLDSRKAWQFLPQLYLYLFCVRVVIWRTALRERMLLL